MSPCVWLREQMNWFTHSPKRVVHLNASIWGKKINCVKDNHIFFVLTNLRHKDWILFYTAMPSFSFFFEMLWTENCVFILWLRGCLQIEIDWVDLYSVWNRYWTWRILRLPRFFSDGRMLELFFCNEDIFLKGIFIVVTAGTKWQDFFKLTLPVERITLFGWSHREDVIFVIQWTFSGCAGF